MITYINNLNSRSKSAMYKNFNIFSLETVMFDITHKGVGLLTFIHRDGTKSVMNLFRGEIDFLDVDGELTKTIEYSTVRDGVRSIVKRS